MQHFSDENVEHCLYLGDSIMVSFNWIATFYRCTSKPRACAYPETNLLSMHDITISISYFELRCNGNSAIDN